MLEKPLGPDHTPFDRLGREGAVSLAKRFYDHMDAHEPELTEKGINGLGNMRDAWLRCMTAALAHESVDEEVRDYLGRRFAEVADFLRNR